MRIKQALKAIVPALVILGVAGGVSWKMVKNKIKPETAEPVEEITRAEFVRVAPQTFEIRIETSGEVAPRTQSTLIPQVTGEIIHVSPNFRTGAFFEKGEALVELDSRDYIAAETESAASLAQAQAALKLEEARAVQAIASWKDLGRGGEPSELTMRTPQLAEATAAAEAAAARLERARRDLERTKVIAPYAGYVREKAVDLGQYVSPGAPLGDIFAIDYVEVRLPLDPADLAFIDLPERYRTGSAPASLEPDVVLYDSTDPSVTWQGRVVRAEGEFDARSRKLFVIAQVDDPYALRAPGSPPLKVGQFVRAEIEGKSLTDVYVIPEEAVRFGTEIKVIDDENRIRFRQAEVIWADLPNLVIRDGLKEGDRLCVTVLPFAIEGALVDPVERGVEIPVKNQEIIATPEPLTSTIVPASS